VEVGEVHGVVVVMVCGRRGGRSGGGGGSGSVGSRSGRVRIPPVIVDGVSAGRSGVVVVLSGLLGVMQPLVIQIHLPQ
jgi:hypothetical protein